MKKILKKIGRAFVILTHEEDEVLMRSVLVVDDGYSSYEHLHSTLTQAQQRIPGSNISILTFDDRRRFLHENFPDVEVIHPDRRIRPKKYQLAIQMFKLRKRGYDFIVLMSLDITPIAVALLFTGSHLFLYNRWNEWYLLRFRNIWEFIIAKKGADKVKVQDKRNILVKLALFIPSMITYIIVFIYLLISAVFIFLYRCYNIMKFKLLRREVI
jgi:hypothetical protein